MILKSDNLQYNLRCVPGLLGRWVYRLINQYNFDRLKKKEWVAGLDLGHSKLFYFCKVIKKFLKN
jgi:hypothetical protein